MLLRTRVRVPRMGLRPKVKRAPRALLVLREPRMPSPTWGYALRARAWVLLLGGVTLKTKAHPRGGAPISPAYMHVSRRSQIALCWAAAGASPSCLGRTES